MDSHTETSPAQRFLTFWWGLGAFVAFGLLGLLVYCISGGAADQAYEDRAAERSTIRSTIDAAQNDAMKALALDPAKAVAALAGAKPAKTEKPVPGTPAFDAFMKKMAAASAAAATAAAPSDAASSATEKVSVTIETIPGGLMKFKTTEFEVPAGAQVALTLVNPDVLQHNLLILKPGTKDKVGALADKMITDPKGMEKGYLPVSDDILAATKLLTAGQSETIVFTAPKAPGDYPYICTFPGHWRIMNGVMKVK